MFAIGRFVIGIANPRQIMIWWLNIAAFLICLCICHLPLVQRLLGLPFLQYLGRTSFAFFLLHPLILRSLGAHTLTFFHAEPGFDAAQGSYASPALMTVVIVLPLALFASHYWSIYVEGKLHALVERHLILKAASPDLPI